MEDAWLLRKRAIYTTERVLELQPDEATETAAKQLQADLEEALKAPPPRTVARPR